MISIGFVFLIPRVFTGSIEDFRWLSLRDIASISFFTNTGVFFVICKRVPTGVNDDFRWLSVRDICDSTHYRAERKIASTQWL